MKKNIVNLLVAFVFTTSVAIASNTPGIRTNGTKAFIVDNETWKSDYLSIEILNNNGELIFDERYKMENGKKFNFERFQSGKYTVILSDDYKSKTQNFVITANEIQLDEKVVTVYKPKISIVGNYIDLNYFTGDSETSISIYDDVNTIYTIKINDESVINKRFNTSNLPKGVYSFVVSTDRESFSKTFKK